MASARGRLERLSALLLLLSLVALACTGDDDSSSPATTTRSEVPVRGGVLRLALVQLASLDPALASPDAPSSSIAADLLFDGLTSIDAGADRAAPALAASWSTGDGGATWRFVLRPDARFSDGRPVTAPDVVYSLTRLVRQGGASLAATALDGVVGYAPFVNGSAAELPGVRAIDSGTVEIVLARPLATLPELLANPAYGVVPAGAADDPTYAAAPRVTSGPFVAQARDGATVTLVRGPGRGAFVDSVELVLFDSVEAAYDAFLDEGVDWTLVPPGRVDDAAARFGVEGFQPFQAELFLGFNHRSPVFADLRFRQAIVAAVDRRAVVNAVFFGVANPLAGIVPEGVLGHDDERCGETCGYDPDRARELLEEAFPSGAVPEVILDYDDGADEGAATSIVEQNLEAVGIPVTRRPHPADQYGQFVVTGDPQLFRLGWVGLYPAPDAYLTPLFASGSPDNVFGLSDPSVDAALAALSAATDPRARAETAAAAERAVLATATIVPIAQFQLLSVSAPRVHDLELTVGGTFDAEAVWVR